MQAVEYIGPSEQVPALKLLIFSICIYYIISFGFSGLKFNLFSIFLCIPSTFLLYFSSS